MELQYKKISENEYDIIMTMIAEDKGVSDYLPKDLELESEMITVAYLEKEIVGLVQIEPNKDTSFVVVFVSINHRNRGIGNALIKYAEDYLKEIQAKKIMTSYSINNENSKRFARKHGYERYFSSAYMKHNGGKFSSELIPVRHYCDEDYLDAFKLSTEAFHEMRVSVGDFPDSKIEEPSKQIRDRLKQEAENRYTYFIDGEIVGHGWLEGNEIGSISVRIDMQGKGIGRKFAKYLCNELYNRGNKEIFLWCVVGNKARYLYESLGFEELYVSEFARKYLRE